MAQFQKSSANNRASQASHRKVIKAFFWENLKQHKYTGGCKGVCAHRKCETGTRHMNMELLKIELQGGFVLTPLATDFTLDILYFEV